MRSGDVALVLRNGLRELRRRESFRVRLVARCSIDDRMGVILIGMPGIEKRLARYPQPYSRIGFGHEYRSLRSEELTAVVAQRFPDPEPDDSGLAHTAALAAIVRATNGNFRLADRLITQVNRILEINNHTRLTREGVDAAQEALHYWTLKVDQSALADLLPEVDVPAARNLRGKVNTSHLHYLDTTTPSVCTRVARAPPSLPSIGATVIPLITNDAKVLARALRSGQDALGRQVGDSRLVGGRPPSAVWRRVL